MTDKQRRKAICFVGDTAVLAIAATVFIIFVNIILKVCGVG